MIGAYRGLQIAELPARDTILAGQTVRDTRLRERTGLSVVGLWERGKLRPAFPDSMIQPDGVIVLAGTDVADRRAQRADAGRSASRRRRC